MQGTSASAGVKLLIVLACALCGLVTLQWLQDAKLRGEIAGLSQRVLDLAEQKKTVESAANRVEAELKRVETLRARLLEQDATNKQEMLQLRKEVVDSRLKADSAAKQGEAYKDAYEKQKAITAQANETILKANESTKQLLTERDGLIAKYNALAAKQESIILQYNALADHLKKLQEAANPAAEKDKK